MAEVELLVLDEVVVEVSEVELVVDGVVEDDVIVCDVELVDFVEVLVVV